MSDLLFNVENGIATITLNRPESYNAFSGEMLKMWIEALETVRDSEDIRVLILTGNGKAFSTGADIKTTITGKGLIHSDTPDDQEELMKTSIGRKALLSKKIQRIPLLLQEIDKPVIAAMNGVAIGAGLDMALMCDIRIAAQSVKVGEGYVKVGLVPGDGGAYFLPRLTGIDKALELLWTGDIISAQEAKELGIITHVVPDEEFTDFVYRYAERLTKGPQHAIRFIKRAVYQGLSMDLRSSLEMVSSGLGMVTELPDFKEGVRAIAEKRAPNFE